MVWSKGSTNRWFNSYAPMWSRKQTGNVFYPWCCMLIAQLFILQRGHHYLFSCSATIQNHQTSTTSLDMTQPRTRITSSSNGCTGRSAWSKLSSSSFTATAVLKPALYFLTFQCWWPCLVIKSNCRQTKWEGGWKLSKWRVHSTWKIKTKKQPNLCTSTVYNIESNHSQTRRL